jgi:signal transduction histidine kinase
VAVELTLRDATLSLQVTDDGVGLPDPLPASARGLGLLGLRERALALGGAARWSRSPSGGTVFQFTAPVRCRAEGARP